jgi:hypothetical protein
MVSPTQMHNALCRSVTIEARLSAPSRSSGSHRDWTDLYRASNSRVEERCGRRYMYRMIYIGRTSYYLTTDHHAAVESYTMNVSDTSSSHHHVQLTCL